MPFRIFKLIALLLCLTVLAPAKSYALDVEAVRFGLYQDKTRLVFDLDRLADFRAFVLSDPYRMVIDLPSFEWKAGNVNTSDNSGVLATRHGNLKPGISRIVFDMNRAVSIQKAFTLPRGNGKPDRLVIDFSNVSPSLFERVKSTVHGTLNTDAARPAQSAQNTAASAAPKPPSWMKSRGISITIKAVVAGLNASGKGCAAISGISGARPYDDRFQRDPLRQWGGRRQSHLPTSPARGRPVP